MNKKTPEPTEPTGTPVEEPKVSPVSPMDEMNKLLSDYKEQATIEEEPTTQKAKSKRGRPAKEKEPEPSEIKVDALINGAIFILLIDLVLPNIIAYANNQMSSKKIKAKKLQLTQEQRDNLEPMANEVAKHLLKNVNPMYMFFVALIGIYGINFMMLKDE